MMTCPDRTRLEAMLAGSVRAPEFGELEAHIEACAGCQQTLETLTASVDTAWLRVLPEKPAHAATPLAVPGYDLLAEAGRGGYGIVYRAHQHGLNRPVALKVLLQGAVATPAERERFLTEARAAARLRHPHIVAVIEVGAAADGSPFFAMEWAEGGSLARRLDGTPLPAKDAAALIGTLAGAVQHAHAQGVIHRDLKPANVLLAEAGLGSPQVSDFGLAKLTEGGADATPTAAVLGTPSYMAPEQAFGQSKSAGPAADVYSLGAILYELLTGRPPFRGATPYETLLQVRDREPVRPRLLRPGLERDLETVCLKCLEKSPGRRYATAQELADDLGRFGRGEPVRARRLGPAGRLLRWARRRPGLAASLGSLAVLAVGSFVAITLLWQQSSRRLTVATRGLSFLVRVAMQRVRVPHPITAKESEALLKATEGIEEILADAGSDPDTRQRCAVALRETAQVLNELHEHNRAAFANARAAELSTGLRARDYQNPILHLDVIVSCLRCAESLTRAGRLDEAGPWKQRMRAEADTAIQLFPDDDHVQGFHAASLQDLARELHEAHAPVDDVKALRRRAVAIRKAIAARHPDKVQHRVYVRRDEEHEALRSFYQDDYGPIVKNYTDAIKDYPAFAVVPDLHPQELLTEAGKYRLLSDLLWRKGDRATAEQFLDQALPVVSDLADRFPAVPACVKQRALTLRYTGFVRWATQPAQAREALQKSQDEFLRLTKVDPNGGHLADVVFLLVHHPDPAARDPQKALTLARQLVEREPGNEVFRWRYGEALARTGNWRGAADALATATGQLTTPAMEDQYLRFAAHATLAVALGKSGQTAAAQKQLADLTEFLSVPRRNHRPCRHFLDEARQLLAAPR